jgi:hypothetical protein
LLRAQVIGFGRIKSPAAMSADQQSGRRHKHNQGDGLRAIDAGAADFSNLYAQEFQQEAHEGVLTEIEQKDISR